MHIYHRLVLTVVGPVLTLASERGLLRVFFLQEAFQYRTEVARLAQAYGEDIELMENESAFAPLIDQLGEYFCGRRHDFDLPLDMRGTSFQCSVWELLRTIPFGKLRSYQRVAREIGRPRGARAVGQAAGQNPLPIVVPCHRVIGADGRLVGFGGGVSLKAQLLRLEGHTMGSSARVAAPQLF